MNSNLLAWFPAALLSFVLATGCGAGGSDDLSSDYIGSETIQDEGGPDNTHISDTGKNDLVGDESQTDTGCEVDCEGRECGPDGCGGTCGTCDDGYYCNAGTGSCVPVEDDCGNDICDEDETSCDCPSDCGDPCDGRECGPNVCDGSCGECPDEEMICFNGACLPPFGNGDCRTVASCLWQCQHDGGTAPECYDGCLFFGTEDAQVLFLEYGSCAESCWDSVHQILAAKCMLETCPGVFTACHESSWGLGSCSDAQVCMEGCADSSYPVCVGDCAQSARLADMRLLVVLDECYQVTCGPEDTWEQQVCRMTTCAPAGTACQEGSCGGPCPAECGNDVCEDGEDCILCKDDCGECPEVCGDGICTLLEVHRSCSSDCYFRHCGDGICSREAENCEWCPVDCGFCEDAVCGDGVCEFPVERCQFCPQDCGDCGTCGDEVCQFLNGENCSGCPSDCGLCPDGICGDENCIFPESCDSCHDDCGSCGSDGDGVCQPLLQESRCGSADCGQPECGCGTGLFCLDGAVCVDGWCVSGDGIWSDPELRLQWEEPPPLAKMTRQEASQHCSSLRFRGLFDWRLPELTEVRALISNCPELLPRSNECQLMESECANPDCTCPVCSELYPEESCFLVSGLTGSCEPGEYFWTSTVCESVTGSCPVPSIDYIWQVGYFNGSLKLAGPEETGLVRCVRGLPDWN